MREPHCHSFKGSALAVAALRQPRPRPADGPGSVTLVSRTGAQRGFVAPLNAAPVCRSATDSSALESERAQEGESPSLAELPARN